MARCLIIFSVLLLFAIINCSLIPQEPPTPPSDIEQPEEVTEDPVPDFESPMIPLATTLAQSSSEVKSDGSFKFTLDNGDTSVLLYGKLRDNNGTRELALDGTYSFGNISYWFIADTNGFKVINLADQVPQHIPPRVISSILG